MSSKVFVRLTSLELRTILTLPTQPLITISAFLTLFINQFFSPKVPDGLQ